MTSNQRRPGFRLPWSAEGEAETEPNASATDEVAAASSAVVGGPAHQPAQPVIEAPAASTSTAPTRAAATAARPAVPESAAGFMRDLVSAMRRVAEETRQTGLTDLKRQADEQVAALEADAEHRREGLRGRGETDIAGVGKWARAETDRIKQEAEQRVVGRRAQLDQELAAETTRAEGDAKALRDRVAEYEQVLDTYHAQLSDIADPAAFAAAAKRMPAPPRFEGTEPMSAPDPAAPPDADTPSSSPNPEAEGPSEVHPAEVEVISARAAEPGASLDAETAAAPDATGTPGASNGTPTATEVLVKGLGSFGAITGFRQSLASVEGIEGVSLSLGPTGEFVFRALHSSGVDVGAAIKQIEGEGASIEPLPEGGLRVTLDQPR